MIWSIAVYCLLPFVLFNLLWRGVRYPAYWFRWPERFGYLDSMQGQRVIWIHAVSVGEVRSSAELVNELTSRYPNHRILVTTMTPTGSKQVHELFGGRVGHAYVPYDFPGSGTESRRSLRSSRKLSSGRIYSRPARIDASRCFS